MPQADLSSQIILVTGATSGIGRATAAGLARRGAHVVVLARDAAKAHATQAEIVAETPGARVDILLADLADLGQVRRAAAEFNARYPRLDVLVNNAGLLATAQRRTSPDGYELTLAINHLGPFLLTALLFDKLRQSPAARIVNTSSALHKQARPDFDDLQQTRGYGAVGVYANTKLYNVLFTQELDRRLRAHGITTITTNALHPGVVATGFGKGTNTLLGSAIGLVRPFLLSADKGAQTTLFLAADPAVASRSGGYYDKQRLEPVRHPFATPDNGRRLWEMSEELTGARFLA